MPLGSVGGDCELTSVPHCVHREVAFVTDAGVDVASVRRRWPYSLSRFRSRGSERDRTIAYSNEIKIIVNLPDPSQDVIRYLKVDLRICSRTAWPLTCEGRGWRRGDAEVNEIKN